MPSGRSPTGRATRKSRQVSHRRKALAARLKSRTATNTVMRTAVMSPPGKGRRAPYRSGRLFVLRPSSFVLSSLVRLEHGQEGLLGDLDLADLLKALLAGGLLGPELALAGDVAAVALGGDVLAHRGDGLAGDDPAADGRLDGDLEQMPVDLAAQLLDELAAAALGRPAV